MAHPSDITAQIQRALGCIHAGQLRDAESLCRAALRREPRNFNALQLLGHIQLASRDYAAATHWLTQACSVNPVSALVFSNLAVALLGLGRPGEALECCETALRLQRDYPEAWCNRGRALVALGRFDESVASYDRALALQPGNLDAWCQCGLALMQARRPQDALAAFDRALELAPDSPEVLNNRGTALRVLKRSSEALECYQRAVRLRPNFPEVFCNAANISMDAGNYEEALGRCDQALRLEPQCLDALNLRGTALRVLKRYAEAAATYEAILAVAPDLGQTQSFLLTARAHLADWTAREELAARIVERVEAGHSASAPHAFLWICSSPELQLRCASRYSADQFPATTPLWRGAHHRHDRLRIAYLSADFADHPVSHLIAGVLERHDRRRFETFGIALAQDPAASPMRTRMEHAFDHFHEVSHASDRAVAELLRDLEIDVAVDLNGHTRGGRLGILACRPVPIQIGFLGFSGTSGAPYIDYVIGDAVVTPPSDVGYYSEKIIRLPDCFLPNDDLQAIGEALPCRAELGLPENGFVYCAFNNIYKISPTMFDVWMQILKATPGSVLWLKGAEAQSVARLKHEAERRGVAADRLVFAERIERMDAHLARYRLADLFLDTLPYGAHATARDALWAGLPVLTVMGQSFASRVAASLLIGLDMPELVAKNLDEYVECARRLGNSRESAELLLNKLARQRKHQPVFNTDRFRRHLEWAYEHATLRRWRDEPPESFDVPPLS